MKNILYISLALVAVFIAWFYLTKQAPQKSSPPEPTNEVAQSLPSPETNLAAIISNRPAAQIEPQPTNIIEPTATLANGLTATNLEQWKITINGLHKSPGLSESWNMEITNRTSGISVPLIANGQTNFYKTRFINLDIYEGGGGKIMEVQMHSPIMNIDETKELGLQLCNMLGQDPADFLAWCDKVGNHWLDAPLYYSKSSRDPDSNRIIEFKTLMTYTDAKPWYIDFIIMNP
jgi:hypothetical protein